MEVRHGQQLVEQRRVVVGERPGGHGRTTPGRPGPRRAPSRRACLIARGRASSLAQPGRGVLERVEQHADPGVLHAAALTGRPAAASSCRSASARRSRSLRSSTLRGTARRIGGHGLACAPHLELGRPLLGRPHPLSGVVQLAAQVGDLARSTLSCSRAGRSPPSPRHSGRRAARAAGPPPAPAALLGRGRLLQIRARRLHELRPAGRPGQVGGGRHQHRLGRRRAQRPRPSCHQLGPRPFTRLGDQLAELLVGLELGGDRRGCPAGRACAGRTSRCPSAEAGSRWRACAPSTWAASSTTCKRTCSGSGRDRPSPAELIRRPLADWPFKIVMDKGKAGTPVVSAFHAPVPRPRTPRAPSNARLTRCQRRMDKRLVAVYDCATTDGDDDVQPGRPARTGGGVTDLDPRPGRAPRAAATWLAGRLGGASGVTVSAACPGPRATACPARPSASTASWSDHSGERRLGCVARMAPAEEAVPVFPGRTTSAGSSRSCGWPGSARACSRRAPSGSNPTRAAGRPVLRDGTLTGDVPPDVIALHLRGLAARTPPPPTGSACSGKASRSWPGCTTPTSRAEELRPPGDRPDPGGRRCAGTSSEQRPTTTGRTAPCASRSWSGPSPGWRTTGRPTPAPTCSAGVTRVSAT